MKNIFVMGLDAFHLELLETIRGPEEYAFHPLFDFNRVVHLPGEEYPSLESLLREAHETFERFSGSVDAVMGYWDLPTTLAVPLIAERFGLPCPARRWKPSRAASTSTGRECCKKRCCRT